MLIDIHNHLRFSAALVAMIAVLYSFDAAAIVDCNENGIDDGIEWETLYVDAIATGADDGSSWLDAYPTLYGAIQDIAGTDFVGEIWVASGDYGTWSFGHVKSRANSFELQNCVEIYGGFDGTETSLHDRDPMANLTILNGRYTIPAPGTPPFLVKYAYHVVTADGVDDTAVLDGFLITNGRANGSGPNEYGAGLLANNSEARIANCRFVDNIAESGGGGAHLKMSDMHFGNCLFAGNQAEKGGGVMIEVLFSAPNRRAGFTNCIFSGNTASDAGGAFFGSRYANVHMANCTVYGNTAELDAGGGRVGFNQPVPHNFLNSIFWENTTGGVSSEASQLTIYGLMTPYILENSCVMHLSALSGANNTAADPIILTPEGPDGNLGTRDDLPNLGLGSSAVDAGNNAFIPTDVWDLDRDWQYTDMVSVDYVMNPRVDSMKPRIVDMGAIELHGF